MRNVRRRNAGARPDVGCRVIDNKIYYSFNHILQLDALSSLGDLGGAGEGGAPQGEHMGELRPGHLVSTPLGALHPSTYLARGLPMATPPPDQTQDTPR